MAKVFGFFKECGAELKKVTWPTRDDVVALGEGGLVRHTKAAMRILEEMFRDEVFGVYDSYTKDLIRMALILHDGFKHGITDSNHTVFEHPVLMSDFILKRNDSLLISYADVRFVSSLVLSHMGPWNKDKNGKEVMPVPKTQAEMLVHLCDYMASRKFLEIPFEGNEIVEDREKVKVLKLTRDSDNI